MFNGGGRDPKDYLDWEYSMDSYFNWYNMFEARRVKFANFKLAKSTKTYWKNIEWLLEFSQQEPIQTWEEIKAQLWQKCVFSWLY